MTNKLSKANMTRSKLSYKYLKEKSATSKSLLVNKEITVWISYSGPKVIILVTSTSVQ